MDSRSALLVPFARRGDLKAERCNRVAAGVLLKDGVAVAPGYFADIWKSMDAYVENMRLVREVLVSLRGMGARHFYLGADAQQAVLPNVEDISGQAAMGREPLTESSAERHRLFLEFLREFRMRIVSTYTAQDQCYTFQPNGDIEGSQRRQLDYVCGPVTSECRTGCFNDRRLLGDHYPVWSVGRLTAVTVGRKRVFRPNFTGWEPTEADGAQVYRIRLSNYLDKAYSLPQWTGAPSANLATNYLQRGLVAAADGVAASTAGQRTAEATARPKLLRDLEEKLVEMKKGPEKTSATEN